MKGAYFQELMVLELHITVQLTVQVTLICSCIEVWETTWAVTVKVAGSIEQRFLKSVQSPKAYSW